MSHNEKRKHLSRSDVGTIFSFSNPVPPQRHSYEGVSVRLRQIFRSTPRFKASRFSREMPNSQILSQRSIDTTDTLTSLTNPDNQHNICLVSDSPHYIVRVAGTGNVAEFEKYFANDLTKLTIANPCGLCAAHNAAARNRTAILALIAEHNGDLNIEDCNGWTPLHHAVRNSALDAIQFLLDHGVKDSHLNKQEEAPIHLAVIHNQLKALNLFILKRPTQVNMPGERQKTPLHYTALVDNVEAAKILTDHGANLYVKSDVGSYPIHVAALNSSNRVFNHLFETVKSINNGTKNLLNICDAENHRPLHSSVIGGNIEAVEICLKNGGSIDDQQDDLSTPVHLASSQGSLDLLTLMFTCQPHLTTKVIRMTDVQSMTPLHKAAMGDHVDVLEFLLKLGSDIDARDLSKRTPLLLAALNSSVQAVCFLLANDASLTCRDGSDRNLLHFTIMQNLPIETIGTSLFKRDNFQMLFDQRDRDGYYPIHYASRDGQVNVLTTLIKHGAEINKKTNQRQSSLHFAAQYGRYNICRQLLDTPGFKRILNEPDRLGQTPLHLCCQNGHIKVVQLLLHKGAQFTKTYDGNTPLHDAATNGHLTTIQTILQVQTHLINSTNRLGMTPLHCAASNGHAECVDLLLSKSAQFLSNIDGETFFDLAIMKKQKHVCLIIIAHERWKEALDLTSVKYRRPLLGLIEHLPDCVPMLFDRCITRSHGDQKHRDFHLTYDFEYINWMDVTEIDGKRYRYPMLPLNMMVKFGRTNHLSHPLCETLLRQKWLSYGFPIYMLNLFFYLIFILAFSYFIVTFPACNHHDTGYSNTSIHSCPNPYFISFDQSASTTHTACIWLIVFYCFINFIFEIIQLAQDGCNYFGDIENYIQWTLYTSTSFFALPFLFNESWHYQWVVGSIGIFSSYLGLLFLLGRFNLNGIYVIMFLEIFKTLLHVLSLFSILIIGFALTFCVLKPFTQDLQPSNPQHLFMIILKSVTMMLGELEYETAYVETFDEQHFPIMNLIVLLLFAIIMPILLMNLLVGLAIGDLMQIQQNARLKRLAMQVQYHTNLEKKIPSNLLKRWSKNEFKIRINKSIYRNLSSLFKHWIVRSLSTKHILDAKEDLSSDNGLLMEMYKQKRRQQDTQCQLEKITDLVRLIVQKMDIPTETESDYTSPVELNENWTKFRQTFHIARCFANKQSLLLENLSPSNEET